PPLHRMYSRQHDAHCRWPRRPPRGPSSRSGNRIDAPVRTAGRSCCEQVHGMIPLVDLRAQYLDIKADIDAAVLRWLDSTQFVLGPEVEAFEREFAAYSGVTEGIAVNTGTSALHLALMAAGVRPGDEVITVPFTFVATVAAIGYIGAKAVFVDIDPATFTMNVAQIEQGITSRTKAIVPVHPYHHPPPT